MLKARKSQDGFWNRLVASIFLIIAVFCLVYFAYHPGGDLLLVTISACFAGVGVWEYIQFVKSKNIHPSTTLMGLLVILEIWCFYFSLVFPLFIKFFFVGSILGFLSFFIVHFRSPKNILLSIAVEFFGVCYLILPFNFMLAILYKDSQRGDGRWWVLYLIAATKITDVGGYLIGKLFGKHRLAPHLSPHKTIEGAFGGFCFAILLSIFYSYVSPLLGIYFPIYQSLILGIFIGILSQIGDLSESALKRDALVKDSNAFLGLGGILDILDSLLFTAPLVYFFIHYV